VCASLLESDGFGFHAFLRWRLLTFVRYGNSVCVPESETQLKTMPLLFLRLRDLFLTKGFRTNFIEDLQS
jgi:hypothetical protein